MATVWTKLQRLWHSHAVTFTVRLALAHVRSTLLNGPRPIKLLIIHDNSAYTSEQQFAPFVRHALLLRRRYGLVLQFRQFDALLNWPPQRFARFDIVGLKFSFRMTAEAVVGFAERLGNELSGSPTRLVYFDGDDDLNVQWPEVLAAVDLYMKKHMFDRQEDYTRRYIGKSNITDYVAHNYGTSFAGDIIPTSGGLKPHLLDKLHLGWNIALDDKMVELSRRDLDVERSERNIDISCRAHVAPNVWTHPIRDAAIRQLETLARNWRVLAPRERVSQERYYEEMLSSRLCVSPFGFGELCWRDFEAVLCGCLLVKPDMNHVRTRPDLYVPYETYIPVRWDYQDLEAQCLPYLMDESLRRRVALQARSRLLNSLKPEWFVGAVGEWLAALNLWTQQKAAPKPDHPSIHEETSP